MATTEIHAITKTGEKALNYVISDKIVPYVSDENINKELKYEVFENNGEKFVRYNTLTSFQNCNIQNPLKTYTDYQKTYLNEKSGRQKKTKKGDDVIMWHLHQSFNGFEVDPETANEIGRKLAEKVFHGFTVTISTHVNTENIHNHLMICAWNEDGKKWHDCHASKRLIREVSDSLCEEYGISVLENTRDMKLVKFKDKDGNTRYYEPTDRKNEIIKKRDAGKMEIDDVNSYRNTPQYKQLIEKKLSNQETIKNDIDVLMPSCSSYSDLIERLRQLGYVVNDKKKNGDWLAHISFKAPLQEKATREDKIGDGLFYTRESLERYFNEHEVIKNNEEIKNVKNIVYFEDYNYGETDLSEVDLTLKKIKDKDGAFATIPRTIAEQNVIKDILSTDNKVRGMIDTTKLHEIITEQKYQTSHKKPYITKTMEYKLVAQIQDSFRCLQYAEKNNIYQYKQIISLYKGNKSTYKNAVEKLSFAQSTITGFKSALEVAEKYKILNSSIEKRKSDVSYVIENYSNDKKKLSQYKAIMIKYKIDTIEGEEKLKTSINNYEEKLEEIRLLMNKVESTMSELENCMRTFDRIDRQNGNENKEMMKEFENECISKREKTEERTTKQKGKER